MFALQDLARALPEKMRGFLKAQKAEQIPVGVDDLPTGIEHQHDLTHRIEQFSERYRPEKSDLPLQFVRGYTLRRSTVRFMAGGHGLS